MPSEAINEITIRVVEIASTTLKGGFHSSRFKAPYASRSKGLRYLKSFKDSKVELPPLQLVTKQALARDDYLYMKRVASMYETCATVTHSITQSFRLSGTEI